MWKITAFVIASLLLFSCNPFIEDEERSYAPYSIDSPEPGSLESYRVLELLSVLDDGSEIVPIEGLSHLSESEVIRLVVPSISLFTGNGYFSEFLESLGLDRDSFFGPNTVSPFVPSSRSVSMNSELHVRDEGMTFNHPYYLLPMANAAVRHLDIIVSSGCGNLMKFLLSNLDSHDRWNYSSSDSRVEGRLAFSLLADVQGDANAEKLGSEVLRCGLSAYCDVSFDNVLLGMLSVRHDGKRYDISFPNHGHVVMDAMAASFVSSVLPLPISDTTCIQAFPRLDGQGEIIYENLFVPHRIWINVKQADFYAENVFDRLADLLATQSTLEAKAIWDAFAAAIWDGPGPYVTIGIDIMDGTDGSIVSFVLTDYQILEYMLF